MLHTRNRRALIRPVALVCALALMSIGVRFAVGTDAAAAPAASAVTAADLTTSTTLGALCPNWSAQLLWRVFAEYPPDAPNSTGHEGSGDVVVKAPDSAKASADGYNFAAIAGKMNPTDFPAITMGQLGNQAIGWARAYLAGGFANDVVCQLLPRLALLGNTTEALQWTKTSQFAWPQTAGPVNAATPASMPAQLWGPDARDYQPAAKAQRDRCHDQPYIGADVNSGWTFTGAPTDRLNDATNPILTAIRTRTNPVTGAPLGGTGFTANAPMQASAEIHPSDASSSFLYTAFKFKNTSTMPYHLNCAVIWWVGPSSLDRGPLMNGHYDNNQRPGTGLGHPQRDIIEVVYDAAQHLSAYVIRIDFHDEPWNMRVAYPNQYWGLENALPGWMDGVQVLPTAAARQQAVDTMLSTLHVEIETAADPTNMNLLNRLKLRNRVTN
jgi:hypothetical protein